MPDVIRNEILSKDELVDALHKITGKITSFMDLPADNWIHEIDIKFVDYSTAFVKFGVPTIHINYDNYLHDAEMGLHPEYRTVVSRLKLPHFQDWEGHKSIPTWNVHEWLICHEIAHIMTDNDICRTGERYAPHGKEFCDNYRFLLDAVNVSIRIPRL